MATHPASLTARLSFLMTALTSLTAVAGEVPGTVHPELWPAAAHGRLSRPEVERLVDGLLARMSLEEKVGQMVQGDIDSIRPADLATYPLGSILAGGNAAPNGDIHSSPQAWLDLIDDFYEASAARPAKHRPIPVLFGIDAVHGHAHVVDTTIFPHNVGLGAMHDPALIEKIGRATAEEVAATGIDWTFAPTVAVVRDVRWGRSYESYSEDPAEVALYAPAMVTGLQGAIGTQDFMAPGHTLASAKHFLGDGGTVDGRDQGNNLSPESELARVHGAGYPPAIAAGVLTVMASYNAWQGVKMHANHGLITDVLKGRMGFDGFVIGDWNAQEEIPGCTKGDCPAAILAGLDMVMAADSWKEMYETLLAAARAGRIPMARIDDAVRRILRVKALAGLFERPSPKARPGAGDFAALGSPEHRALARQAVRESLVLLKNDKGVLPLDPRAHLLVAGDFADDVGAQAGGWTLDWQGNHNSNADLPAATSIFAGIRDAVARAGGTAVLSPDGSYTSRPDAAIVVFGEGPYAEFQGDRETVELSPGDRHELALLRRLRAAGIPIVSVFLSGRPLWVNPELDASDAFVAAWLPGSEGGGVADLLFKGVDGKPRYDFTGRLAFSWPATGMPVTYDGDRPQGALFPRGYGLADGTSGTVGPLDENSHLAADRGAPGTLFQSGHVTAPWSIYVSDAKAEVRLTMPSQPSPEGAVTVALGKDGFTGEWPGGHDGVLRIGGRPADLHAAAAEGMAVTLRYRIDAPPAAPVRLAALCGKRCAGAVDVTAALKAAPVGAWRTLSVGLGCFAAKGADLSQVEAPMALETSGRFAITVADIRLAREEGACQGPS